MYKSADGGGSWNPANNGLSNTRLDGSILTAVSFNVLAIDPVNPFTLYVGTYGRRGVIRVPMAEEVGAQLTQVCQQGMSITLAIDPVNPATLYVGTGEWSSGSGGGVFKSIDGGGSWSSVNTGLPNAFVRSLAIDPTTPATIYAGTSVAGCSSPPP